MNDDGLTKVQVVPTKAAPVSEPPPSPKGKAVTAVETKPIEGKEDKAMSKKNRSFTPVILMVLVIVAGVASGYALSVLKSGNQPTQEPTSNTVTSPEAVVEGKTYGAKDGTTFPDKAEGVLVKGGIEGEGSHHLMRDGGPSRNVYLTSSVLDLDMYANHLVEVDGETFNAQKAGWLMDVGQVKVIKLNAEKPFAEATPAGLLAE